MAVTKLDKVLDSIGEDGNLTPYFEALMTTTLIVPLDPENDSAQEDEIDPMILGKDGMEFIPMFDSVERFEEWAEEFDDEISSIEVLGVDFFEALDLHEELHIVINHLTDYEEIIYPENIIWIKDQIEAEAGDEPEDDFE